MSLTFDASDRKDAFRQMSYLFQDVRNAAAARFVQTYAGLELRLNDERRMSVFWTCSSYESLKAMLAVATSRAMEQNYQNRTTCGA